MIWSQWRLYAAKLLPAAIAVLTAAASFFLFIFQQRRDAKSDALRDARDKDLEHADDIRDRVRAVPDSLHEYSDRGFRD